MENNSNNSLGNKNNNLTFSFSENITKLQEKFSNCPDVKWKRVYLDENREGCFIYIEGLINVDLVQRDFMKPIISMSYADLSKKKAVQNLSIGNISLKPDIDIVVSSILSGVTAFIMDGINYALCCDIKNFEKRVISEPETEKNIKGSHEGFIESLNINMSLLRRNIKYHNLKFKTLTLGTVSHQNIAIAYIESIADRRMIDALYNKIKSVNFDGFPSIGHIQQFVTDFPNSPFPQYQGTERVDKAISALLEGRLVVMLDGTPVTLIVPVTLFSLFQAPDDYSTNWMFGTFLRLLRMFATIIAIFLPALYVAITSFHYYMVPMNILVPLAESRSRVAFPPLMEAFIMEITLDLLRESAVRLPTYVGASIGVVGGIVIGQAAVQAGIVSDVLIIVVAVTAIASFIVPSYDMSLAIRLIRFIIMIFSAIFGIIGVVISGVLMFAHLLVLESLGQPYFQPIIPLKIGDIKDSIIRAPIKYLKKRPDLPKPKDMKRGKNNE